jgi:hypothetical protein
LRRITIWNHGRILRVLAVAGISLLASTTQARAQGRDQQEPSSTCWRFAFGAWTPPLDWERSGHDGKAGDLANRVQRVRDSVFAKDTNAVRNSAMIWERTRLGWSVVLFPTWWPVGVKVDFDSVLTQGREMTGQATAFVADAGQDPSRARARAVRCPR